MASASPTHGGHAHTDGTVFKVTDTGPDGLALKPPTEFFRSVEDPRAFLQNALPLLVRASHDSHEEKQDGLEDGLELIAASGLPQKNVISLLCNNALMQAAQFAFVHDTALRLNPQDIWVALSQGFAVHVEQNAEKLRGLFVSHKGKKIVTVTTKPGLAGAALWSAALQRFPEKLNKHLDPTARGILDLPFSTANECDAVVNAVILMNTFQPYFAYGVASGCGFPYIRLLGTVADWQSIRDQAELFRPYGLDWWLKELLPVLDMFVAAAKGNGGDDGAFWNSLVNKSGSSGWYGGPATGWVQVFFPYMANGERSNCLGQWKRDKGEPEPTRRPSFHSRPKRGGALPPRDCPSGVGTVPVCLVDDLDATPRVVTVAAGMFGFEQVQTKQGIEIGILHGWGVVGQSAAGTASDKSASRTTAEMYHQHERPSKRKPEAMPAKASKKERTLDDGSDDAGKPGHASGGGEEEGVKEPDV